ncbi:hypothetical protein [Bradyrhizobium sp. USDA 4454]
MNVDPRIAADTTFEAHDVLQQPSRDRHCEDQASFEQQLDGLDLDDQDSVFPKSDSVSSVPDSTTGLSSSAPSEAPNASYYPAASFVSARAQLAATLTGATLEALRNEINLAERQSARWSPATAPPVDRDRVFEDVAGSSYVTLRRFQNQDSDCKPRAEENTSAISHVRNTARDHTSVGYPLERYPLDRARQAGWHMRGKTTASAFVSLVEDPEKLAVSRDTWARAIANNADALHTYTVPKSAVWTPDDVLSSIGLGMNADDSYHIDGDVDLMCSLGRTPTRETERLFLGGNLESYRTASEANPYKHGSNE